MNPPTTSPTSATSAARDLVAAAPFDHREAMAIADAEYRRYADLLDTLAPSAWERSTDCPAWTVAGMTRHLIGSMAASASVREQVSQLSASYAAARRSRTSPVDELSAEQVRRGNTISHDRLASAFRARIDGAVRGRTKVPSVLRSYARFRVQMGTIDERWNLGFLVDTVLTRDTWMHRVDVSRAVDVPMVLDPAHDGRIVADIAREWVSRHGRAVSLVLTGPAGGRFSAAVAGAPPETLELDAVEFCRVLAGRAAPSHPLLRTEVAF